MDLGISNLCCETAKNVCFVRKKTLFVDIYDLYNLFYDTEAHCNSN